MPLEWVLWSLLPLFALHDGEEVLTWNWWMRQRGRHIFDFGGGRFGAVSQNRRQMTVAVLIVGAVLAACTVAGAVALRAGAPPYLFGACLAIWLLHSLIHLGATLYHRMYTPGVATALLVCLPHGLWSYQQLLSAGALSPQQALLSGLAGLACAPLLLLTAHRVAARLSA